MQAQLLGIANQTRTTNVMNNNITINVGIPSNGKGMNGNMGPGQGKGAN